MKMKWTLIFMAGFVIALIMQCYRDDAVEAIGKRTMCAKLSDTMQAYDDCIKHDFKRIKDETQN